MYRRDDRQRCAMCDHKFYYVQLNGINYTSRYCRRCYCGRVVNGHLCQNHRKYANYSWCQDHLQCSAPNCWTDVKNHDPVRYGYCSAHGCETVNCPAPRQTTSPFCASHVCPVDGCRDCKTGEGQFCARHTCESQNCTAFAPGTGDAGGRGRLCHVHQLCEHHGCGRRPHIHDNGEVSGFCGEHYCRWNGCGNARRYGQSLYCPTHSCRRLGCQAAHLVVDGFFCAEHECSRPECRIERFGDSRWCSRHKCGRRSCDREGTDGVGFCSWHQACVTTGCNRDRFIEEETVHERCDDHRGDSCRWAYPPCANRAAAGGHFCMEHTCLLEGCAVQRSATSRYCDAHKCSSIFCPERRIGLTGVSPLSPAHGGPAWPWAPTLVPVPFNGFGPRPYCAAHTCYATSAPGGCRVEAVEGSRLCQQHKCRYFGCANEVAPAAAVAGAHPAAALGAAGLCFQHAQAAAMGAPAPVPVPVAAGLRTAPAPEFWGRQHQGHHNHHEFEGYPDHFDGAPRVDIRFDRY